MIQGEQDSGATQPIDDELSDQDRRSISEVVESQFPDFVIRIQRAINQVLKSHQIGSSGQIGSEVRDTYSELADKYTAAETPIPSLTLTKGRYLSLIDILSEYADLKFIDRLGLKTKKELK